MSKRFKSYALFKGKKTVYRDNEAYTNEEVADLLNEQQDKIHRDKLSIRTMLTNMEKLEKENEQLKQKLENKYTVEMIDGKFFINLSELIGDIE